MATYHSGPVLSLEQVAQIAAQAGFSGQALVDAVAIASRESQYDTHQTQVSSGAHRTDGNRANMTGDRGVWQINSWWDGRLKAAGIINSGADLLNPAVNAKAAFWIWKQEQFKPWGMSSSGWTGGGNPLHGTNQSGAARAVQNAQQQGLLGQAYTGGGGTPTSPAAGGSGVAGGSLPSDGYVIKVNGYHYVVFGLGSDTFIRFSVSDLSQISGRTVANLTPEQFAKYNKGVNGGDAKELTTVTTTFGTFGKFWDSIVEQVMGKNNPAATDPEVRRVIAELAGRPDMSPAELQNKLRATQYWQKRTEGELQWNSYSEAERASRRQDTAAKMVSTWVEFAGQNLNMNDPMIQQHVEAVASGKMSWSEWTESYLKPRAAQIPESPWYRQRRTELENQRQRPIDIENTASKIRGTLRQWGLHWSEASISGWAGRIVGKTHSDDDLLKEIQNQSKVLFPLKDPEMETATYAAPWLETYGRVMEEDGTVFTPEVAKALSQGTNVWDFEQGLKKSGKWLNTKNARDEMYSLASEVGSRLGFV